MGPSILGKDPCARVSSRWENEEKASSKGRQRRTLPPTTHIQLISAKKLYPKSQVTLCPVSNMPFLQYADQLRETEIYETEHQRRFPRHRLQPGIPKYSLVDAGKAILFTTDDKHFVDCLTSNYVDQFQHWAPDKNRISSSKRCEAFMKTNLKPHGDLKLNSCETTSQYLNYFPPVSSVSRDYSKFKCSSVVFGSTAPGTRLPDSTANEHYTSMVNYLKRPKITKKVAYDISSRSLFQPDYRLQSYNSETRDKFEISSPIVNLRPSPAEYPALNVLGLNCRFNNLDEFKSTDYPPFFLEPSTRRLPPPWIENRNELLYVHHNQNRDLKITNMKSLSHSHYPLPKPQPKRIAHKVNDKCWFNIGTSNGEKVDYSLTTHSQDYTPFEAKRPKKLVFKGDRHVIMGRPEQFPLPMSSNKDFHVAYPKGDCWDNPPDYPVWKHADDGKPSEPQTEMSRNYGPHKLPTMVINKEAKEKLKYTTSSIKLHCEKCNTYETTYNHYHQAFETARITADFKKHIDLPKTPQQLYTVLSRVRTPITGCKMVK